MKISTRGRYALRMMLDLAQHREEGYITIRSISMRQGISEKYLEQIVSVMNRAGFLRSVRGAQGGYQLMRQPSDYTVGEILRSIEGNLVPVACMDDDPNRCPRCSLCATLPLWQKIDRAVRDVVDNITLEDLISGTVSV